jgi:hypothetical protein
VVPAGEPRVVDIVRGRAPDRRAQTALEIAVGLRPASVYGSEVIGVSDLLGLDVIAGIPRLTEQRPQPAGCRSPLRAELLKCPVVRPLFGLRLRAERSELAVVPVELASEPGDLVQSGRSWTRTRDLLLIREAL